MQRHLTFLTWLVLLPLSLCVSNGFANEAESTKNQLMSSAQAPTWSQDDLSFFLHGSMGAEFVPDAVLRAFIKAYPDLFPTTDLTHLGLIPDPNFGWPIGLSRRQEVKHLGGLPGLGINCAACHVAQLTATAGGQPIQILGATSHFNVEAFYGSIIAATFRTADLANMKKFFAAYLAMDPLVTPEVQDVLAKDFDEQLDEIGMAINAQLGGTPEHGQFYEINGREFGRLNHQEILTHGAELSRLAALTIQLFHNLRAALHVPDQSPAKLPPASGPGRNDAFGILAASLLKSPQPYTPSKFGLVWNVDQRIWVHWDGNTRSPIARNLLAALGLGAPLEGKRGDLDFALVKRQTDLSEKIRPPRYPFTIDEAAAKRGATHFASACASCHGGPESDKRLHSIVEVGTDPGRANLFTPKLAADFNKFLAELEIAGYTPPRELGVRSTGKYWAATLAGVWARSPYLHNGAVRTIAALLTSPNDRPKTFHRGSPRYDSTAMGYTDEGAYLFDTATPGNSNSGHDYGTNLSRAAKVELMEYLKTL